MAISRKPETICIRIAQDFAIRAPVKKLLSVEEEEILFKTLKMTFVGNKRPLNIFTIHHESGKAH